MASSIILSIAFTFSNPTAVTLDTVAIVTGHPKRHKIPIYKAKNYDPFLYLGNYPFRAIV